MIIRTLLVDDEALARAELRHLLEETDDVEVVGEAADVPDAAEKIRTLNPDLVFLDISMPGSSGFDLFDLLGDRSPQVIFATASASHAVEAFETSAVGYLLKPILPEKLHRSLATVRDTLRQMPSPSMLQQQQQLSFPSKIGPDAPVILKDGDDYAYVKVQDIWLIEATGNYVRIYFGQRSMLQLNSMRYYEERLPEDLFFRASRTHIINLSKVTQVASPFKGRLVVELLGKKQVEISQRQAVQFKARMQL